MRILVLGGTTEASALARHLAERPATEPVLSLAGRTSEPRPAPIPTRTGGFGGVDGLAGWLRDHGTQAVIDATHPFAAIMSRNAAAACARLGIPLLALRRPAWRPGPGDCWREVPDMEAAVAALGEAPTTAFLTVGRLELDAFAAAPRHRYVVRTIEPLGDALTGAEVFAIRARGPFDEAAERALMEREGVRVLVTKNSGGSASAPKLAAARSLGLPVILVARPEKPDGPAVATVEEVVAWLEAHGRSSASSPSS